MSVTAEQYGRLLQEQEAGQLILYVDTTSFRKLFMSIPGVWFQENIGESLRFERTVISLLFYLFDPMFFLIASVAAVFVFRWGSLIVLPVLLFSWAFVGARACLGQLQIWFTFLLVVGGVTLTMIWPHEGTWSHIFLIAAPFCLLTKHLIYFMTTRFAFSVIYRNFAFLRLFWMRPGDLGDPYVFAFLAPGVKKSVLFEIGDAISVMDDPRAGLD